MIIMKLHYNILPLFYSRVYLWEYVLQYIVGLQGQPAQREQRDDDDEHFYDLEKNKNSHKPLRVLRK